MIRASRLVVLAEIATRALSPVVNDPGTARAILAAIVKVTVYWVQSPLRGRLPVPKFNLVSAPSLREAEMLKDALLTLARHGAADVDVSDALQKALGSISRLNHGGFNASVKEISDHAIALSSHAGMPHFDLQRLRESANQLNS